MRSITWACSVPSRCQVVIISWLACLTSGFLSAPPLPAPPSKAMATHCERAFNIRMEGDLVGSPVGKRSRRQRLEMIRLPAVDSVSRTPPPEVYKNDNARVRRNLERLRQVDVEDTKTIRATTSSALRQKLRLSGRDKRARVFLPINPQGGSLNTLNRLLKETFPLGDFPVALYVKTSIEQDAERTVLTSDQQLHSAMRWATEEGLDLRVLLDVHPDYAEVEPPEWLVDVPDPALADEWEMISFYRFVDIDQPETFATMLQAAWSPLGVRGRVYVAPEGVNAQMAVPCTSSDRFERAVEAIEKLSGVYLNKAERRWSSEQFYAKPPFPALHVRARRQIVADGLDGPLECSETSGKVGRGLSPEEWHKMLEDEAATILDCRNMYESKVGIFDKAVPLETSFFRESWDELQRLVGDADRDAPIMTYCTGGIRCVKIAAYLEQEMGFRNVTRLEGGIVSYSKFAKEKGLESKFKGVNYVFDARMGDEVTGDLLSSCLQCGQPCAAHTNCANPCCHARLVQCPCCAAEYEACCSLGCKDQLQRPALRNALMVHERDALVSKSPGLSEARAEGTKRWSDVYFPKYEGGGQEPMWLTWPFQDPSLNMMIDRACEEFRETEPSATEDDASRMIKILARLGGGTRALAVGLGSGGAAGRACLRCLAEGLGQGGEMVVVEESREAAKAARGLSLVSNARGCSITVLECDESAMLEHIAAAGASASSSEQGTSNGVTAEGSFDVVLLGGGGGPQNEGANLEESGIAHPGTGAKRTAAERLDLVLDRRLIKKTGLVLCDPSALVGGAEVAQSLMIRAAEAKSTLDRTRLRGTGSRGGLLIFKWKTYSH